MTDPQQLLLANFVEALKQLQRYVVLGLGTSVTALALTLTRPTEKALSVTVPGTFVALDPLTARVVLLAVCFLVGAMASYAAQSANIIARGLDESPELLRAASTYPSFAMSPYAGVRYGAALLPLLFSTVAVVASALRERPVSWGPVAAWLVFLVSAYVALALELRRPIGALS